MSKRVLSLFFVLMLMVGGAAACGDDSGDDGGDDGGSSEDSGDSGDDSGDSGGNADVEAYCESVQEFVDASEALAEDPTDADAQQTVTDLGTQLAADAQELATSLAEDPEGLEAFQACQTDFSGVGG